MRHQIPVALHALSGIQEVVVYPAMELTDAQVCRELASNHSDEDYNSGIAVLPARAPARGGR